MKSYYIFSAAFCLAAVQGALASALSRPSPGHKPTPGNTPALSASSQAGGVGPSVPVCGAGFTYCGYILRDHKNFQEADITKAYCAAHKSNCVNGTTKTDPIQALYLCVPPNANPLEAWSGLSSHTGDKTAKPPSSGVSHYGKTEKNQNSKTNKAPFPRSHQAQQPHPDVETTPKNKRFHHHIFNPNRNKPLIVNHHGGGGGHSPNRNPSPVSASTPTTLQTPQSTNSSPPSSDSSPGGDCASSVTKPGNKIELLCACGRQCLNPLSDHIGRCDIPCSS